MKISLSSGVILLAAVAFALPQLVSAQAYWGQQTYYGSTAQLVVTTQVASGTTIPPYSATVTVNAAGASLTSTPGSTGSVTYPTNFASETKVVTFVPGNYNVTVSQLSGYAYTYSPSCSGAVLTSGGTATCTVTISNYTSGAATLMVYTNVTSSYYGGYGSYSPSNFTINVSGNSPTPSSFIGNSSGTSVALGAGTYSVNPQTLGGWTMTQSGACNGVIQAGENRSCNVTYTSAGNGYCGYPYNNCSSNYATTLTCYPSYSQVASGQTATFSAQGGLGTYSWSVAGQNFPNAGSTLNTILPVSGFQTVTVSSAGQTATCSVNVTPGTGYIGSNSYTTPTFNQIYTSPVVSSSYSAGGGYVVKGYPTLPNTGYEPQNGAAIAFAIVILLAGGVFIYPYARRTITSILG